MPVAELGTIPYVIAVNPNVPAQSVTALIRLATAHPGKLNGSAGGNSSEMAIALFRIKTGTRMEIIPYKGTGHAALAVATGEADDKAGGYAIQGRAGQFIVEIRGSYSGVMGLPLFETAQLIEKMSVSHERRNTD